MVISTDQLPAVRPTFSAKARLTYVKAARTFATVVLGILLPTYLLFSAHQSMVGLEKSVSSASSLKQVADSMPEATRNFKSGNDYSLLFAAYVEQGIQRTLLNRLKMKAAIMQLGMAISCIGLLFIVFGIDAGGVEAGIPINDKVGVNLKIATSGAMVFVLGALLAAGGGLMPSTHTGGSAQFWLGPPAGESIGVDASSKGAAAAKLLENIASCDKESDEVRPNCRRAAIQSTGVFE